MCSVSKPNGIEVSARANEVCQDDVFGGILSWLGVRLKSLSDKSPQIEGLCPGGSLSIRAFVRMGTSGYSVRVG